MKTIILNGINTHYLISETGQVINTLTNKELHGTVTTHGYRRIIFSINGQKISKYLHRLMAIAFLDFDENSNKIINHKDGNKLNNCLENLRYVSRRDNLNAALYEQRTTNKCKRIKASYKGKIQEFNSIAEASRILNIDGSTISKICRGIGKSSHGYQFQYLE